MLVLSRKVNERIQIGSEITVTVVRLSANTVRLGVEAPSDMAIVRDDIGSGSLGGTSGSEVHVGSSPHR